MLLGAGRNTARGEMSRPDGSRAEDRACQGESLWRSADASMLWRVALPRAGWGRNAPRDRLPDAPADAASNHRRKSAAHAKRGCGSARASAPLAVTCSHRSTAGSPRALTPPTSRRRRRGWRKGHEMAPCWLPYLTSRFISGSVGIPGGTGEAQWYAGVLPVMCSSWAHLEQRSRGWRAGSPPSCRR